MKTFIFICVSVIYAAGTTSAEDAKIVTNIGGKSVKERVHSVGGKSVKELCLYAHNTARNLHQSTPPVTYDDTIAAGAQEWAKKLADLGYLEYDRLAYYGENMYAGTSLDAQPPAAAVFRWYQQSSAYNYNDGTGQSGTGEFTQVVWKATTKIGCGVATRKYSAYSMSTFIVVRYYPAGNVRSQYLENVKPLNPGASISTQSDLEP